jgi:hypothetical protein
MSRQYRAFWMVAGIFGLQKQQILVADDARRLLSNILKWTGQETKITVSPRAPRMRMRYHTLLAHRPEKSFIFATHTISIAVASAQSDTLPLVSTWFSSKSVDHGHYQWQCSSKSVDSGSGIRYRSGVFSVGVNRKYCCVFIAVRVQLMSNKTQRRQMTWTWTATQSHEP